MDSIWTDSIQKEAPRLPLTTDLKTDVLIIGGGLAGLLCAYQLKQAGVSCVVIEAETVGSGTTAFTSAKVTAQHGLIYGRLLREKGPEAAKQYYRVNQSALAEIKALAQSIPCDWEEKTAYLYSRAGRRPLEQEASAYETLGIPYELQETPPLPFETAGALGMKGQAQFHPLKFLRGISQGLAIYEHTRAIRIQNNRVHTQHGAITANRIILATHYPMVNIPGLFFMKLYQERSYLLSLKDGPAMEGMYLDAAPGGYSFRNYDGQLLLGGGGHRTGKPGGGYAELKELARNAYPDQLITGAWATQDCMPLDGLPYIGVHHPSTPHLYVATGFQKWGMTSAMAASVIIKDLLVHGHSDDAALFSPSRFLVNQQLLQNLGTSAAGFFHLTKRCTHMGCALQWNRAEHSWDCPCHGSRFDECGHILNNPAKKELSID